MTEGDTVLLSKPAKLQISPKQKVAGKLTISRQAINWVPENVTTAQAVRAKVNSLKGQQKAKKVPLLKVDGGTIKLILEFEDVPTRDGVWDIVQALIPTNSKGQNASNANSNASKGRATGKDAVAKKALLEQDKDVRELFNTLVLGGVISDAEFWRTRGHLLKQSKRASKDRQKIGLASSFMAEMTSGGDGTSQKIRVQLTPEVIRNIFSERPHIHRAFLEHVPNHLDERDFWSKFCKHEYALQQKRKKVAEGKLQEANQVDDEFADLFADRPMSAIEEQDARSRVRCMDPTINLVANDDGALYDGYGVLHHAGKADLTRKVGVSNDLARDLNRHGNVVLDGVPDWEASDPTTVAGKLELDRRAQRERYIGEARSGVGEEVLERVQNRDGRPLEDLRGPETQGVTELKIGNMRDYLEQADNDAMDVDDDGDDNIEAVPDGLEAMTTDRLRDFEPLGTSASQVLSDMFHGGGEAMDVQDMDGRTSQNRNPADVLPHALKDLLRSKVLIVNELLRHFWASYPLSSAAREAKVNKIRAALTSQHESLQDFRDACRVEERPFVQQLIRPVLSSLEAASAKYNAEASKRTAQKQ
ncbi:hypothetical protein BSKO_07060 [Bryopsis sp. KO-2023]|nr:hypothetical protein BSKO_07060 [Bryopsis sp. KO-2023]